jgi:hypothetical protein
VARATIKRFEWLGTVGRARLWFGLHDPAGELLGVVGFGHGAHDAGRCGALVLERGCTLPHAPPNAGSYLIGRALRALRQAGWQRFKAYSDPVAGETRGALPGSRIQALRANQARHVALAVCSAARRQGAIRSGDLPPLRESRGGAGCGCAGQSSGQSCLGTDIRKTGGLEAARIS